MQFDHFLYGCSIWQMLVFKNPFSPTILRLLLYHMLNCHVQFWLFLDFRVYFTGKLFYFPSHSTTGYFLFLSQCWRKGRIEINPFLDMSGSDNLNLNASSVLHCLFGLGQIIEYPEVAKSFSVKWEWFIDLLMIICIKHLVHSRL